MYNRAGIAPDSFPSLELMEFVQSTPCVVCSDLARAVESAARLAPGVCARISPLFREAGRPFQENTGRRATLAVWDRLSVYLWRTGRSVTDEPIEAAENRADLAVDELIGLTRDFGRVICVGHGTFNRQIGAKLLQRGWTGPAVVAQAHWSATTFLRGQEAQACSAPAAAFNPRSTPASPGGLAPAAPPTRQRHTPSARAMATDRAQFTTRRTSRLPS